MPAATFDGPNRIIILPTTGGAGTLDLAVGSDLYSAWKIWARTSINLKFAPAFRAIAGDPLPGGVVAEPYYFLQNQTQTDAEGGWRVRPAEEDATYNFSGQLVPEDPTDPITVPSLGGFTALLNGIQPITQGIRDLQILLELRHHVQGRKLLDDSNPLQWQEVVYDRDTGLEVQRYNLQDANGSPIADTLNPITTPGTIIAGRIPV